MVAHDYVLIVIRNIQQALDDDYHHALRQQGYRIEFIAAGQDPAPILKARPPIVACFQFDYPDFAGLTSLRETKQAIPSVPLLMITQAHSESLAVWAFRTRVWDYFVQPFDITRFLEVMAKLHSVRLPGKTSLVNQHTDRTVRDVLEIRHSIPLEARLHASTAGDDHSRLQRALSYIDQNLHRRITQAEIAKLCGLSTFQFSRFFKQLTEITFQEYLLHRRISEARRLLANPKVSITDVCFTVGFRDLSYFTRIFQRYVGQPPSRYRLEATLSQQRLPGADALAAPPGPPESLKPVEKPVDR
jgi:AraC-like DNA-binding protein